MSDFKQELNALLSGPDGKEALESLREMVKAKRNHRFDCQFCGKRNSVEIIDAQTRLRAIELWAVKAAPAPGKADELDPKDDPANMTPQQRAALFKRINALLERHEVA